jgi:hypothetical protein
VSRRPLWQEDAQTKIFFLAAAIFFVTNDHSHSIFVPDWNCDQRVKNVGFSIVQNMWYSDDGAAHASSKLELGFRCFFPILLFLDTHRYVI